MRSLDRLVGGVIGVGREIGVWSRERLGFGVWILEVRRWSHVESGSLGGRCFFFVGLVLGGGQFGMGSGGRGFR